jgi:peptidoglycan hydrolase CwlO-like protein
VQRIAAVSETPEGKDAPLSKVQLVNWGFYAMITVLATNIATNFSDVKTELISLNTSVASLNTQMAVVITKDQDKDKELERHEKLLEHYRDRIRALEQRIMGRQKD